MAKKKQPSSVVQLLDLVYERSLVATGHSWARINNAMQEALKIAIGSGFKFELDDWKYIRSHYKSDYWLGSDVERWYAICVSCSNMSAIVSFETMMDRPAYIADDVTPVDSNFAHVTGRRQSERLAVGSRFRWDGKTVTVTSFGKGYLTACSYKPRPEPPELDDETKVAAEVVRKAGWQVVPMHCYENKVLKRYKITRQDIIDDRAVRKSKESLWLQIEAYSTEENREQILQWLGNPKRSTKDAISVAKLQSTLKKCEKTFQTPDRVILHDGHQLRASECRVVWDAVCTAKAENCNVPATLGATVSGHSFHWVHPNGDARIGCQTIPYSTLKKLAKQFDFPIPK